MAQAKILKVNVAGVFIMGFNLLSRGYTCITSTSNERIECRTYSNGKNTVKLISKK